MKLLPVLVVLYIVHISHYNNNPSACLTCIAKLIETEACKYLRCHTGSDNKGDENNGNNEDRWTYLNYENDGNNGSNENNNNKQNINVNINTIDNNGNTDINTNQNRNIINETRITLENKAIEFIATIGKTLVKMWDKVFGGSDNKINDDNVDNNENKNNDDDIDDNNGNKKKDDDNKKGLDNPDVIEAINAFFAQLSENQTKTVLISKPDGLVIDEIYITGLWDVGFDPEKTESRSFYLTTETIKLPTMINTAVYNHGINLDLDASLLELPFDDGLGSLLIVLPNSPDGIVDLMNQLQTPSVLENAISEMDLTNVHVFLPKFQIETMFDLKTILGKIAIPGVTLRSNNPFQKVIIEINEDGKASSSRTPLLRKKIIQFKVQWPFYFEVRFYNTPLFNGVYGIK